RRSAEEASRAKSDFLAGVSHEIRTPMTAIFASAQLMERRELPAEHHKTCVSTILSSGRTLLQLIDELLDISRIEAGKLKIEPRNASIDSILEDALLGFRLSAESKGLEMIIERKADCSDEIFIDPLRFKQIISNLVANALKFTETG